jgi:hypothetical protein
LLSTKWLFAFSAGNGGLRRAKIGPVGNRLVESRFVWS